MAQHPLPIVILIAILCTFEFIIRSHVFQFLSRWRGCIVGVMLCLAGTPAMAQSATPGQASSAARSVVTAGNFNFTLSGCRAVSVTVDCDIAIENRTPDDRHILVISRQKQGSAPQDIRLRSLGVSTMIDDAGNAYEVDSLRLSNQDGANNGQSSFEVYAGTLPVLTLHFDNVGLRVTKFSRLTLVVAEQTPGLITPLSVVFNDQPIARQATESQPRAPATSDRRFVIETPAWRLALRGCRAVPDGVGCTLIATNLSDARGAMFVGWQGHAGTVPELRKEPLGRSKMINDTGAAFIASQMFVQSPGYAAHEDISNGQQFWQTEPFADRRFDLYFTNIGTAVARLPRLDLAIANLPLQGNQGLQSPNSIGVRFMDIPVVPMVQNEADATVAPEWVPEPKGSDPDGKKLRFCSASATTEAMLQLLRGAAQDRNVQGLSAVAALPAAQRTDISDVQIASMIASPVPGEPQSADFLCNVTYRGRPPELGLGLTDVMMNLTWVEPFHGQFRVTGWTAPQPFVMLEMLSRFPLSASNQYRRPLSR
jgi:hypothetical protein